MILKTRRWPTHIDTNAEAEHHSLKEEDSEEVRPPGDVQNGKHSVMPAITILRHARTGDANKGLDAAAEAVFGKGNRSRVWQLAVVHAARTLSAL